MHQLLVWTLGVTTGAVALAAANGQYFSVVFAAIILTIIVWHLKRQKDEGKKL